MDADRRFQAIEDDVKTIKRVLNGDGNNGLVTSVRINTKFREEMEEMFRELQSEVVRYVTKALLIITGFMIAGFSALGWLILNG